MHKSTRRKLDKIAIASIALGCVLIVAFGLKTLLGGESDPEGPSFGNEAFIPFETEIIPAEADDSASSGESTKPDAGPLADALSGGGIFGKGGDNTLHAVVMTAASDGGMYAGWRFRGGAEGVRVADRSLVVKRSVRGALPVAQMGVQVLSTSSYVTCTISVDGVVVSTRTVRGVNRVAVCSG